MSARRWPGAAAVAILLASACGGSANGVPVVVGPDIPGVDIVDATAVESDPDGTTSEVTITTDVRFGPAFISASPGPLAQEALLAESQLGTLDVLVTAARRAAGPVVEVAVGNPRGTEATSVVVEATFTVNGEARPDAVAEATASAGSCAMEGDAAVCTIGTVAAGGSQRVTLGLLGQVLLEGPVEVTAHVRADASSVTDGEPSPPATDGPSPTDGATTPAPIETSP